MKQVCHICRAIQEDLLKHLAPCKLEEVDNIINAAKWRSIDSAPKDGTEVLLWGFIDNRLPYINKMYIAIWDRVWWSNSGHVIEAEYWQPVTPPTRAGD